MHDLFRTIEIMMEQMFMFVEKRRGKIEPRRRLLFGERVDLGTDEDGLRITSMIDSEQDTIDQIAGAQTDQSSSTDKQHLQ